MLSMMSIKNANAINTEYKRLLTSNSGGSIKDRKDNIESGSEEARFL